MTDIKSASLETAVKFKGEDNTGPQNEYVLQESRTTDNTPSKKVKKYRARTFQAH